MTYFNNLGQGRIGWRSPGGGVTPSTLWNSIYGVWNADTLGTSLDTSIYAVYNGDNVNDSSGNSRNGTNVGGVTFTTGKVGNAFTFNGSNCIGLPNNSMNLTGDFSVSFWANVATHGTFQNILSTYYNNSGQDYGFFIRYAGNGIPTFNGLVTGSQFSTNASGGSRPTNTWEHFVITKTNSQIKWYINGVLDNTFNGTYNISYHPTSNVAGIGALYKWNGTDTAQYMSNGSKIDGLTVWNKVLTADEITSLYNVGTGAEYPFSSQLLPSPNDAVSTNHGTLVNGTTFAAGKIGQAFNFDGVNDMVTLPNNSLNINGDFSASAWVKYTIGSGIKTILSNNALLTSPTRQYGWGLYLNSNNILFQTYDSTSTVGSLFYTATLTSGTWYHITVTKSGTTKRIYLNGTEVANASVNNITYTATHRPTIGGQRYDATGMEYFSVSPIDAVSVWNRELTSADVTELYNSGTGKQYPN